MKTARVTYRDDRYRCTDQPSKLRARPRFIEIFTCNCHSLSTSYAIQQIHCDYAKTAVTVIVTINTYIVANLALRPPPDPLVLVSNAGPTVEIAAASV